MSKRSSSAAYKIERQANVFAALGDPTRHLTVLEDVGLVSKVKGGRESLYALDPTRVAAGYLQVLLPSGISPYKA